jgi:hypothetical protein
MRRSRKYFAFGFHKILTHPGYMFLKNFVISSFVKIAKIKMKTTSNWLSFRILKVPTVKERHNS